MDLDKSLWATEDVITVVGIGKHRRRHGERREESSRWCMRGMRGMRGMSGMSGMGMFIILSLSSYSWTSGDVVVAVVIPYSLSIMHYWMRVCNPIQYKQIKSEAF